MVKAYMEIVHVAMVDMMIKYITMEMLCKVTPFIFATKRVY